MKLSITCAGFSPESRQKQTVSEHPKAWFLLSLSGNALETGNFMCYHFPKKDERRMCCQKRTAVGFCVHCKAKDYLCKRAEGGVRTGVSQQWEAQLAEIQTHSRIRSSPPFLFVSVHNTCRQRNNRSITGKPGEHLKSKQPPVSHKSKPGTAAPLCLCVS